MTLYQKIKKYLLVIKTGRKYDTMVDSYMTGVHMVVESYGKILKDPEVKDQVYNLVVENPAIVEIFTLIQKIGENANSLKQESFESLGKTLETKFNELAESMTENCKTVDSAVQDFINEVEESNEPV